MIDIHLNSPPELIGIEVACQGDHWRAIKIGAADTGRQVGGTRPQGCDGETRRARQTSCDVGAKTGGPFMRGQHKVNATGMHGLDHGQDIAAGHAEPMAYARRF